MLRSIMMLYFPEMFPKKCQVKVSKLLSLIPKLDELPKRDCLRQKTSIKEDLLTSSSVPGGLELFFLCVHYKVHVLLLLDLT